MENSIKFIPLSGTNKENSRYNTCPSYIITIEGVNILLDCGFREGHFIEDLQNYRK